MLSASLNKTFPSFVGRWCAYDEFPVELAEVDHLELADAQADAVVQALTLLLVVHPALERLVEFHTLN